MQIICLLADDIDSSSEFILLRRTVIEVSNLLFKFIHCYLKESLQTKRKDFKVSC